MHLTRDLRYAWRGLARSPLFTLVAVASIALGIGANTAIFTLVDQVLLSTLPVRNPQELVLFNGPRNHYGNNSGGNMLSYAMYEDFRDNFVDAPEHTWPRINPPVPNPAPIPKIFSGMFARRPIAMNVGVDGQTERVSGELVSGTYFSVLGVKPVIGRVLMDDDDKTRGDGYAAVLSYDYWRNRFGGDPNIVGRPITINNYRFTVVGVSQPGFDGLDIGNVASVRVPVALKAQMTPNWDDMDNRRSRWVNVFGRLKPGVTQDQALAILQPFFHGILEQEVQMAPFSNTTPYTRDQFVKGQVSLLPAAQGRSPIRQQLSEPLKILFAIVAGVLLISCANVAGLLVARASTRQKEVAVRLALGASRSRIVAQLLVESLMLATIGGIIGLALATWTTKVLIGFLPSTGTPHVITGAIDARVLAFNFALALATGVVFGLVPALRSTKPALAPTLKDQVGAVVGGGSSVRLRKTLVIVQVAISIVLLIGAGIFIRSLRNLRLLDLGLRTDNLIAFNVSPTISGYSPLRTKRFEKELLERVKTLPGVSSMAFAQMGLLEGNEWDSSITVEGYDAKPGEEIDPYCNAVSPDYFKTMGIPLVEGRDFDDRDVRSVEGDPKANLPSYQVAIVNQSFAKKYFGERSPVGRHIGFGMNPGTKTPIEIIGVVKDAKYTGVRDEIPLQAFFAFMENDFASGAVMYVRTANRPDAVFGSIRQVMQQLDSNIPMYNMRTLEEQVNQSLLNDRLIATLSTAFGVLATLLAVIGLYGVMAYTVARRTREIGVRMALGAARFDVVWLVMREVLTLVGCGIVIGLVFAFGLKRYIGAVLFGVGPTDPVTIVAAVVLLGVVALLAGHVPARRATGINPVTALRYE
ncbi:MAG TPA: ABC transporter permease [Vicinamibacterales bacterium]|jgi:predicted permease